QRLLAEQRRDAQTPLSWPPFPMPPCGKRSGAIGGLRGFVPSRVTSRSHPRHGHAIVCRTPPMLHPARPSTYEASSKLVAFQRRVTSDEHRWVIFGERRRDDGPMVN